MSGFTKILFTVICCTTVYQSVTLEQPVVDTPYGRVAGTYLTSYSGRRFSQFLSVPYAKPPVGELRFEEPQRIEPWQGVWQANFSTVCAQLDHLIGGSINGQEDCLYLNIYAPQTDSNDPLDVIIDIHGGGFNFGSSTSYSGPHYLMDRDVVFVTVNYRLGIFGFLSTEDEVVPGNNGMKDQVMAIQWVNDNIGYFGGNPNSITLTGLSAGGASVHLHFLSPLSKGLFKGGISLSGNALCPWVFQDHPLQRAREVGSLVGCAQESTASLVSCLKQRSVTQVLEGVRPQHAWMYNPFSPFGIVAERHGRRPFLPDHPYELLRSGKVQDLPWITSLVKHEGLYPVADFMNDDILMELERRWNELMPYIMHYSQTVPIKSQADVSQKIKDFYFHGQPLSMGSFENLIEIGSDRLFAVDAEKSLRLQASSNLSPTYYYYFTYESEKVFSFAEYFLKSDKRIGICHGDDLSFIFYNYHGLSKYTSKDEKMKNILLDIWTSFAKTGVPKVQGVEWKPVSRNAKSDIVYLDIRSPDEIQVREVSEMGHRSFWDSLGIQENENLFKSKKEEL
ncbi:hypothetical protein PPYR_13299 [Photinus pyralis]|uniref:Carboxylic ester hydrolase n=1 Tax=Photinus pyralis TaxID=7054 RepID=A0A1Y1NET1_PHOPY|nr:venom carboxylesterase-6-like [Photinus pyralis]KAB0793679.1 hypothetical protein PPYR_13299 [Photinus pyralis]